jgi:hypothetical protein
MSRRYLRSAQPACKPCRGFLGIDWSHPLAHDLRICVPLNEQGGNRAQELVTRTFGASSDAESHWQTARRYGKGWDVSNQEDQVLRFAANAAWDFSSPPITLVMYGHYFGAPVTVSIPMSCGSSSTSRFAIYKESTINASNLRFTVRASSDAPVSGLVWASNTTFMAAASYDGANVTYFMNGQSSVVAYTQTPNTTGDVFSLGDQPGAGNNFNGVVGGALVYSRALGLTELRRLYADPWCMLQQYPRRSRSLGDEFSNQPLVFVAGG